MKTRQIMPTLFGGAALVALMLAIGAGPADARRDNHGGRRASTPHERCGKALLTSHQQVLGREASLLGRCARALAEEQQPRVVEYRCSRLARSGLGADKIERIARRRIQSHCAAATLPAWLPPTCLAQGPELGAVVSQPAAAASCTLSSARCMALAATTDLFGDIASMVDAHSPMLFDFELGGVAGHTLKHCLSPATTTTTLPPTPSTTTTSTTTLPEPTTTTSTTTLPPPPTTTTSTTLPLPTTTTTSTTLPAPEQPSIVITEIMTNPAAQSDTTGEYFEIENTAAVAVDLEGMTFRDLGSNSFTVNASVVVEPGARAVLARSATAADGLVDYIYGSSMSLGNSADQVIVEHDGVVLDQVAWDSAFPLLAGASMELAAAAVDPIANDSADAWCASDSLLSDGDYGTPGAALGACQGQP